LVLGALPVSCLYDPKHRCGQNQHEISDDRCACDDGFIADKYGCHACGEHQVVDQNACVCAEGYVKGDDGCHACGKHEVISNGACICDEGYFRTSDSAACGPLPDGLGVACNDTDTPCAVADYDVCHVIAAGAGYCTSTCAADQDCLGGYTCNQAGSGFCQRPPQAGDPCDDAGNACAAGKYELCHLGTDGTGYCTNACTGDGDCSGDFRCHDPGANGFCRRPATGHGDACESAADCAGKEADYCETIQSHLCLVRCSAGNTAGCFEGESCCDFAVFNPICVPTDQCTKNGGKVLQ
jgi:hypothetical protein